MYKLTMEDGEIILKGKGQRIGLAILIGVVVILFVLYYLDGRNRREIKNDFEKTLGILTKYEDASSVEGSNINIEYSFTVDSKSIFAKNPYDDQIQKMSRRPIERVGKKYWVIYQKNHPEKSLVNIEFEIEGENSISFPDSLDDFF